MPDTPTTRLGLYKSAANGSELVNYTQDLGNNWDKVDAASGFQVVTSGTRPAAPYAGKPIAESDTGYRTYFSNGTSPASASWVEIPNSSGTFGGNLNMGGTQQINIGGSGSTAAYAIRLATATGDYVMSSRVVGDANSRYTIRTDGQLAWGAGVTATDTFLARGAAGRLDLTTTDLRIATTGRGLQVAEGTNAKMGVGTLVAGTVTVANTSVTANSRIFLTCQTPGGTPGFLRISARTAGTSFTILSSSGTDTSVVAWFIVEP
ncbi:hypothetical protein ACWCRC_32595 [Streptomyces sp. NPDC001940]